MRRAKVSDARFVATWNAASTMRAAAAKLGISRTRAARRAGQLRDAGAAVKQFPLGRPRKAPIPPKSPTRPCRECNARVVEPKVLCRGCARRKVGLA